MGMEPQPQLMDYASPARPRGYYRWVICALIFFATTVNYVDRQIIGVLAPTLKRELKWSDAQYGDIVFYFQLAYAIGLLLSGPVIDRIGTKLGYALSLLIWSFAAMAHAMVRTVSGFSAARFALGLGEAGNFPAANKTIAWNLKISEHTVKFHVASILSKLNASSRTEAVTIGLRKGFVFL